MQKKDFIEPPPPLNNTNTKRVQVTYVDDDDDDFGDDKTCIRHFDGLTNSRSHWPTY